MPASPGTCTSNDAHSEAASFEHGSSARLATNANKIRSSWSVTRLEKEYCQPQGRYRPLLLDSLARAPSGQDLPFADLTGRFVQSDRDAVHKQDPALICGGLGRS